jgi:L-serine dehydratase, iron-sulfur-dependent, beta subunit
MQGIFDMIGPIMIGPSSSHTAGAARLGAMGRLIFGRVPKKAEFFLHGSFAKTYKGHGTDKALAAGILGFRPDDARLRDALEIAKGQGLELSFQPKDLGSVHPNSVQMVLSDEEGSIAVQGASIGGGSIRVEWVGNFRVDFTGEYNSLITIHRDRPGIVAAISGELAKLYINIAFMKLFREGKGKRALMIIETDYPVPQEVLETLEKIEGMEEVLAIPELE